MSTCRELCEAIHANPDEDVPRLMLADWLQEYGESGQQRDRGELIRHQLKFDCQECGGRDGEVGPCGLTNYYRKCHTCEVRRAREDHLIRFNSEEWLRGPKCDECAGERIVCERQNGGWLCIACAGTGDAGGLTWRLHLDDPEMGLSPIDARTLPRVEYVRGMKRVHLSREECLERVTKQDQWGTYQTDAWVPSPWLLAILTHHPDVVEVQITNLSIPPHHEHDRTYGVHWFANDIEPGCVPFDHAPNKIPGVWAPFMRGAVRQCGNYVHDHQPYTQMWWQYPTIAAAVTELARAVVRWGRSFLSPNGEPHAPPA